MHIAFILKLLFFPKIISAALVKSVSLCVSLKLKASCLLLQIPYSCYVPLI